MAEDRAADVQHHRRIPSDEIRKGAFISLTGELFQELGVRRLRRPAGWAEPADVLEYGTRLCAGHCRVSRRAFSLSCISAVSGPRAHEILADSFHSHRLIWR